jgi:hypothetical protein
MNHHTYPDRRTAELDLEARDIKRGADVVCEREWPAAGTWSRYAGRVGRVGAINIDDDYRDHHAYVEIGVKFTNAGSGPTTWFLPAELKRVYSAHKAPWSRERRSDAG